MQAYKNPEFRRVLDRPQKTLFEVNRSCGDQLNLYLVLESAESPDARISDISFEGEGCSVCLSSAEFLCRLATGEKISKIQELGVTFESFLTKETIEGDLEAGLPNELRCFEGLRNFPMRQKCALMAWRMISSL